MPLPCLGVQVVLYEPDDTYFWGCSLAGINNRPEGWAVLEGTTKQGWGHADSVVGTETWREGDRSLWAQWASQQGTRPDCLGPIHPLHKSAQVCATCYDPGKLAPSNEHHTGGKQWDLPPNLAMGSCNELSWALSFPVLYWYIPKPTLYFYGFMRILWCKGSCLKLKITRSQKPGSARLSTSICRNPTAFGLHPTECLI